MKKIIVAFDVLDTPSNVIDFATKFAEKTPVSIHAVFLKPAKEGINFDYLFPNDLSDAEDLDTDESVSESNAKLIDDKLKLIKDKCEAVGISFSSEKNISIQQLIEKTTEADFFIADSGSSFIDEVIPHIQCSYYIL